MNTKRLNINENYSFKSTTSIRSSYQSSLCSCSQLEIERTLETQSTASGTTTDYVQNTMIIKVDTASYATILIKPEREDSSSNYEISESNCASDSFCNFNEIKECLGELKNTLDRIDTSALAQYPVNNNFSNVNESSTPTSTPKPSLEETFDNNDSPSAALTPKNSNASFIVKKTTNSLPAMPQLQYSKRKRNKNFRKSIVDLYTYYNYEWKRFKRPGDDPHMKDRWNVHKKFFKLK